jgi:hypothetical protein
VTSNHQKSGVREQSLKKERRYDFAARRAKYSREHAARRYSTVIITVEQHKRGEILWKQQATTPTIRYCLVMNAGPVLFGQTNNVYPTVHNPKGYDEGTD